MKKSSSSFTEVNSQYFPYFVLLWHLAKFLEPSLKSPIGKEKNNA